MYAKKEYYTAHVWKHNSNFAKKVIVLMISNGEGWSYLAVKQLSALLRGLTSKHDNDFYWLNYLLSFATENKLESSIKLCENKDFCNTLITSEYT